MNKNKTGKQTDRGMIERLAALTPLLMTCLLRARRAYLTTEALAGLATFGGQYLLDFPERQRVHNIAAR